jgi:hypothetical protein
VSVHGEYSRALESLFARVRLLSRNERDGWLRELDSARVDRNPDLSAAARKGRHVLESISKILESNDGLPGSPDADFLREPIDHLSAHCRAILGCSD